MGEPSCEGSVKVGAFWPSAGMVVIVGAGGEKGTAATEHHAQDCEKKKLFHRETSWEQGTGNREQGQRESRSIDR